MSIWNLLGGGVTENSLTSLHVMCMKHGYAYHKIAPAGNKIVSKWRPCMSIDLLFISSIEINIFIP